MRHFFFEVSILITNNNRSTKETADMHVCNTMYACNNFSRTFCYSPVRSVASGAADTYKFTGLRNLIRLNFLCFSIPALKRFHVHLFITTGHAVA